MDGPHWLASSMLRRALEARPQSHRVVSSFILRGSSVSPTDNGPFQPRSSPAISHGQWHSGDGLLRADGALAALVQDPELLDRARARFGESPPRCPSHSQPSGTTTRSQSPNPLSEAQKRHDEKKWRLIKEYEASLPYNQFDTQASEELERLFEADRNRTYQRPAGLKSIYEHADANVRKCWAEQGIWNHDWDGQFRPRGYWKHEDPPKPGSEAASDSETPAALFSSRFIQAGPKRKRPAATEEDVRREEREREASRPIRQFMYQVSGERELIQDEANRSRQPPESPEELDTGNAALTPPDINTTAYERVKSAWIRRGIWNAKWGVLPGMWWKHEQPFDEMLREQLGEDPVVDEANHHDANDAPPAAQPRGGLFEPVFPPESAPSPLPESEASQPPAAPASRGRAARSTQNAGSPAGQRKQRGARAMSVEEEDAPGMERKALGPIRPSKISKPRKTAGTARAGRGKAAEAPAETISSVKARDPPSDPDTPRRSTRLRAAEDKKPTDSKGDAGQSKEAPRKTRRASAGVSKPAAPAKPQGVTKGRPRATRRKPG